ncbi:MAG: M48 family metalloprotease [Thermoplasmata archaeon]|nr:M48 family metalloprotease [Thermoplasmata archaeon]
MASLGALKRSMALTLILIFGLLFALIVLIFELFMWYTDGTVNIIAQFIFIFILVGFFMLIQWAISPSIIRWGSRLKYLKPGEHLWLEGEVRKLAEQAEIPMPQLAIANDPTPNAFVFGRSRKSSTLAVHTGLLERLNQNEIRGVLAHEIGHLRHNDVVIMTVVSVIPLLAFMLARSVLWSGGRNRNSGAIILAAMGGFVVYIISQLLILKLSRQREYFADSYSAVATGDPHSLSSALAKITFGLSLSKEKPGAARAFYIGDPVNAKREIASIMQNKNKYDLDGDGVLDERELQKAMEDQARSGRARMEFMSTHPSTFKRIMLLKQIETDLGHGAIDKNIYKYI